MCGSGLSVALLTGEIISVNDTEVRVFYPSHIQQSALIRGKGTLIPPGEDIKSFFVDDSISWVLVVEKEVRWP